MIIFAFDSTARRTGHCPVVGTVGGKNVSLTRYDISRCQTLVQNVLRWMRINESTLGFFGTVQKWRFVLFLSPNIGTNLELKPSVVTFLSHFELIALGQFYHISFHWRVARGGWRWWCHQQRRAYQEATRAERYDKYGRNYQGNIRLRTLLTLLNSDILALLKFSDFQTMWVMVVMVCMYVLLSLRYKRERSSAFMKSWQQFVSEIFESFTQEYLL